MAINLSGISLTSDVTGGGGVSGGVTAKMKFIPVTTLPPADEAKKTAVYLLPSKNTTTKNKYDEYVVLETASGFIWELFGQDVSVDLQSFATKTELNKKQDKLVNQQSIRSINGIPLLGAGNIQLETLTTAEKNKVLELIVKAIEDAPTDGKQYARKDGEWSEVEATGGGGSVSAEETDEIAASVEESIMTQYGTSIAQLGLELSEIGLKKVTWAELKSLRDNGQLKAGNWYRITDYECTTSQDNTRSAGHRFDVIVLALDEHTLSKEARACLHEGDTYFENSHLEAWKIWYSLDNDETRFAWADEEGHGVIYRMIDEWGNDVPYDFKNIQFVRALNEDGEYDPENGDDTWVYTFNGKNLNNGELYDITSTPHKISEETRQAALDDGDSTEEGDLCYNNKIAINILKDSLDCKTTKLSLNNIVFLCVSYDFGYYEGYCSSSCLSNTFDSDCYNNTFGNECSDNTFGYYCFSNTLGNGCCSNKFGERCNGNTLGNGCCFNKFGEMCYSNKLGDRCSSITFGYGCHTNTFGNDCYSNTFVESSFHNTFGNGCYSNTFGYYCQFNKLGDWCSSITFGDECYDNTFGTSTSIKSYMRNITLGNGVCYTYINCSATTSGSKYGQNIHVCSGVQGIGSNRKTLTITTAGNDFLTTFGSSNDVKINV